MSRKLGLGGVKPLVVLAPNKWTSEDDKTITWKRTENLGSDNLVFGYHHLLPFIPSNPNEPNDTHYNKSEYSNDKTHVFSPGTYSLDKHGFAICAMTEQPIKLKKFKNIIIEFQEWINDVSKLDGVIELWPETEYSNLENNEYKYYPILTKDEIAEKENDLIVINTASGFNTASGKRILLIRPKEKKDNNEIQYYTAEKGSYLINCVIPKEDIKDDDYRIIIKSVSNKSNNNSHKTKMQINSITLK